MLHLIIIACLHFKRLFSLNEHIQEKSREYLFLATNFLFFYLNELSELYHSCSIVYSSNKKTNQNCGFFQRKICFVKLKTVFVSISLHVVFNF